MNARDRPEVVPTIAPAVTGTLLAWFRTHRRPLPWRLNRDPYRIWVSEVLLQQTRVAQAVPYFERFVAWFPNVTALARADRGAVLKAWEGAGYYARARNLHAAARILRSSFGGALPRTVPELETLPGVGPYIARAIASLAFRSPEVALEANGLRVAARWTREEGDLRSAAVRERLRTALQNLAPPRRAGSFNEALMELGETVCLPGRPPLLPVPGEALLPGPPRAGGPGLDPDGAHPYSATACRGGGRRARASRALAGPAPAGGGALGRPLGVSGREGRTRRDPARSGPTRAPRGDRDPGPTTHRPRHGPPRLQPFHRDVARLRRDGLGPAARRTPPLGDPRGARPPGPAEGDREGRPVAGTRSGYSFPGFRIPSGSHACRTARKRRTAGAPSSRSKNPRFSRPIPCSELTVPPRSSAAEQTADRIRVPAGEAGSTS